MTEKLILINVMHENTPYFFHFPFFEIFRGAFASLAPPHGAAPEDVYHNTIVLTWTLCIKGNKQ